MNSIRFQVMKKALLSILISMSVCGIALSTYLFHTLQQTILSDAGAILRQASAQISFMMTDVDRLISSITVEEELEELIADWNESPNYSSVAMHQIRDLLRRYATQRNYIYSVDFIDRNHRVLRSSTIYEIGSSEMLETTWFLEFEASADRRTTSPVYKAWPKQSSYDALTNPPNLISKVFKIQSLADSETQLGYIMVSIDVDQFRAIAESLAEDFDEIMILSPAKDIVLNATSTDGELSLPQLLSMEIDSNSPVRLSNGFAVCETDADHAWSIAGLIRVSHFEKSVWNTALLLVLFLLGSVGLTVLLMWPLVGKITRKVTNLSNQIVEISKGNLDVQITLQGSDELEVMGACFNQMAVDLKKNIEAHIKDEKEKKDVEYSLLLTQLNPHFIYNTIDTAVFLIRMERGEDAAQMLSAFVEILQGTVCLGEQATKSTVQKEVALVRCYMEILHFRFHKQIRLEIETEEEVQQAFLPKFLLQPFVENAVFHGFAGKDEDCRILLRIKRRGEMLSILIADNGVGMAKKTLDKLLEEQTVRTYGIQSISIHNLYRVLLMSFGERLTFRIESERGSGTRVYIQIPLLEGE